MGYLRSRGEAFLAHYASPNYDPVKAHEYYLKTRALKGRHSTKGFSENQKKGFTYAKAQIRGRAKTRTDQARVAKTASIEQVRSKAQTVRMDISEKLKAFNKMLSEKYSETSKEITEDSQELRKNIAEKLKADIAAVPDIPKGTSALRREQLLAIRAEKIAKLRGDADKARSELDAEIQTERVGVRTSVQSTRKSKSSEADAARAQVAGELKAVVAKYIAAYNNAKAQIKSESEATLDKEYKNIKSKVR